jgi:2-succinyl-5-enolpyruvyl-6-hydroxy-3-cyclohexene-1-carboxylate synthase
VTDSTALARHVVAGLLRAGVTEVVLAPGSRNAPLAFASYDAAEAGLVRLHTRVDERSAAFLALGLSRNHARAAVVCTSGTAVANLHPALLEAAHSGIDLVAVTADRPARMRGTSANQTTDQIGVFAPHVATVEVADLGELRLAEGAPTHLDVPLEEPLLPTDRWVPEPPPGRVPEDRPRPVLGHTTLPLGPRTVVVAGDDASQAARRLAERAGWPLLAEPSSGSRTGEQALRCYRLLLDSALGRSIERVVVLGRPTLSRPVTRLLGRDDVEVLSVAPPGLALRRPFACTELDGPPAVDGTDDPAWLEQWRAADAEVARGLDRLLAERPDLTPHEVAAATHAALPAGGLLVVGASNPIRDLDLVARPTPVGSRRKVVANRGLAGIDGTVSTAIGAALARPPGERNLALMGDVTFLHDSGGLVLGPDEPRPDLTIVVVNDDGGSIFATLEQGGPEHAHAFERLFATPHHVDLGALCAATRTPHLRVTSRPELEQALASPNGGIEVVEAVVGRADRRALDAAIRALAPA